MEIIMYWCSDILLIGFNGPSAPTMESSRFSLRKMILVDAFGGVCEIAMLLNAL